MSFIQDLTDLVRSLGPSMKSEIGVQAKMGIPALVGGIYAGVMLQYTILLLTVLYILVQIAYLARKWWREETTESGWLGEERRRQRRERRQPAARNP